MYFLPWLILALTFTVLEKASAKFSSRPYTKHCKKNLNVLNFDLRDAYCDQPLFVTFLQKTEENLLLDNICQTYFQLPDDPSTFQVYISRVYCDGSTEIISFVATIMETGICKFGSPYCTFSESAFGYAGCDTWLMYRCFEFGDCGSVDGTLVFGLSQHCKTIGLSCLRKVDEIVDQCGISNCDYYILPMKLPNRCITQQICVNPPNPFYNHLPGHSSKKRHSIIL